MDKKFEKFIGLPCSDVKKQLENEGYLVDVVKCSLMKIKSDYELVVNVKLKEDNKIELVVGDFLINIEKL